MFLKKEKIMMIHIPKTGGTAASASLKHLFRLPYHSSHSHLNIASYQNNINPIDWNEIFKFSYVRCPKERMVSSYKQLVSKSKRRFTVYTKFNKFLFNKWLSEILYPHIEGYKIKSNDKAMIEWVKNNIAHDKPSAFNSNIYHFYLGDNILENNDLMLLDFRYPKTEFFEMFISYQKKITLDVEKWISPFYAGASISNIRSQNKRQYAGMWSKENIEIFNKHNLIDIEFYKEFVNRKENNNERC